MNCDDRKNHAMANEEYRGFLEAVYRKHVRPWRGIHHPEGLGHLHHQIERFASNARLARVVAEHAQRIELYATLGNEIEYSYFEHDLKESGMLDALDAYRVEIFGGLRRDVIPDIDIEYLRVAGFNEAEAEVVLLIQYARTHMVSTQRTPSQIVEEAEKQIKRIGGELKSAKELNQAPDQTVKRTPKLFNGIAKICSGGILSAGNLLLGVGAITAPGPATAHMVIGSCALAVAAIGQGIGDLRGE